MDYKRAIEKNLEDVNYEENEKTAALMKETLLLISQYESENYTNYTKVLKNEINEYRKRARGILIKVINKQSNINSNEEMEGLSVLKNLNKQLHLADLNQTALEKGTVKLETLNYTNTDIMAEINKASKKIVARKNKEKSEMNKIKWAYKIFLILCALILLDKFYCRVIRPSLYVYKVVRNIGRKKGTVVDNTHVSEEISAEREIL